MLQSKELCILPHYIYAFHVVSILNTWYPISINSFIFKIYTGFILCEVEN